MQGVRPIVSSPVQRYYQRMAAFYDVTRRFFLFDRTRIVHLLGLKPGNSVLEIGVGTGHNLPELVRRVGPKGHITGLDFSPHMLRRASQRIRQNNWRNIHLVCADAAAFSLHKTYHAILFSYSLSMIPSPHAALDRTIEHLHPNGQIGILDFGSFSGWGPISPLARRWLGWHRVRTNTPDIVTKRFPNAQCTRNYGGYNLITLISLASG